MTGDGIPRTLTLTTAPHLFDDATRVTAGDSCWQGRTSDDYWAFVGDDPAGAGSIIRNDAAMRCR